MRSRTRDEPAEASCTRTAAVALSFRELHLHHRLATDFKQINDSIPQPHRKLHRKSRIKLDITANRSINQYLTLGHHGRPILVLPHHLLAQV